MNAADANCERTERIHLFVDGELNPLDADEVRRHLASCADCQSALDEVLQLDALIQTTFEEEQAQALIGSARPVETQRTPTQTTLQIVAMPTSYVDAVNIKDTHAVANAGATEAVVARVLDLPSAREKQSPRIWRYVELRGALATPSHVLAEMEKTTEIDIDAHGLVDVALSDASLIALSPDANGAWALSAAQVRKSKLSGHPLVILAACRAAVGAPLLYAPWSLPAAFLEAGASAVLASRDDIPDAQARDFFDAVLAGIHAGKSERAALRDARLQFRARPDGAWVDSVLLFE